MAKNPTVAVVGLGYVGLPLALALGRKLTTIGFDISPAKIHAYKERHDPTGEMSAEAFKQATLIQFTLEESDLKKADVIIVAVPTPIDDARQPDLSPVIAASRTVGRNLKPGAIVVYESTVYPGVTEEVAGPILEKTSGLARSEFKLGYSPERINPGDKTHTIDKVVKVVAGEDDATLETVAWVYGQVVDAGVYRAPSIRVAEAAKVIENTQRDLNIALMNELAIIFNKMGIDTQEVLKAAGTKWNFLPFRPGLVGGHCIGVDPYYLTFKAQMYGYHPEVILAGRRINDNMGKYVAEQTVKKLIECDRAVKGARVLVMGLTFKENCSDLRNSRVIDVIRELRSYGAHPIVWDPIANPDEAQHEYSETLVKLEDIGHIDAVVAAVAHTEVTQVNTRWLASKAGPRAPFMDVKAAFDASALRSSGFEVWRL